LTHCQCLAAPITISLRALCLGYFLCDFVLAFFRCYVGEIKMDKQNRKLNLQSISI